MDLRANTVGKRKKLIIIILSVLLFICVCFGIFVLIENKTDKVGDFYVKRKGSSYRIVGLINTEQKEVLIPKRLGTIAVKSVGAFLKDNEHVESITVESGVEEIEENAFSNCKNLKSVNLPYTLKEIGNYILSGSRSITELTAPFENGQTLRKYFGTMYPHSLKQVSISKGCSEICKGSFEDYRIIKKVIMPNSITKIGENAFSGCSNLVDVQFSNNLMKIEDGAFKGTAIQELEELPTVLESVGSNAFESCKELTNVILPNSLVELKEFAFKDSGISSITLSIALSVIEKGVFEGNSKLEKIDLSCVKNIKSNAFYNCSSLYEVVLNDDTETVGEQAFFGTAIETISIPKNIKTISKGAFESCFNLQSVELNNAIEIGESAFKNCPLLSNINVSKVEIFDKSSFEKCENILSIDVQRAKIIGDYAFSGLKKLTEIKIPLNATEIGKSIFWRNIELKQIEMPLEKNNLIYYTGTVIDKLEKVIIPSGSIKICDNAFYEYPSIKFEFAETIEEIGDRAFSGMKFDNVTLPKGVSIIGEGAFYNCKRLSSITLPDGITEIADNSFYNCSALVSIVGNNVKAVGNYAFSNCDKLKEPTFLPLVNSIGDYAFFSCDGFDGEIDLSSAITVGGSAFSDCVNIIEARLSNTEVKLGAKAFNNCINLEKVINLSCASEIGAYAFNNCVKLNKVELGDKIRVLEEGVFYGCVALLSVELPKNLEYIESRAFYNCSNLEDVKIANEQAVIMLESTNAFLNCSANLTISVPEKVLQQYLQDDNWKLLNVIN